MKQLFTLVLLFYCSFFVTTAANGQCSSLPASGSNFCSGATVDFYFDNCSVDASWDIAFDPADFQAAEQPSIIDRTSTDFFKIYVGDPIGTDKALHITDGTTNVLSYNIKSNAGTDRTIIPSAIACSNIPMFIDPIDNANPAYLYYVTVDNPLIILPAGINRDVASTSDISDIIENTESSPIILSYNITPHTGNSSSCLLDTEVMAVSIDPTIGVTLSADAAPAEYCPGATVVITALATGGSGTYSYNWSAGDEDMFIDTYTNSNFLPGSETISVTVQDNNSCEVEESISVTILSPPTISLTSNSADDNFCEGEEIIITASVNGGTNNSNFIYEWTLPNNDNESTQNLIIPTATQAVHDGFFKLSVTEISSGCITLDSIEVNVIASPIASINTPDGTEFCEGADITLTGVGTGENYLWSGPGIGSNPTRTNKILEIENAIVGTDDEYTFSITNAAGCIGQASVTISVNGVPDVSNISSNGPDYCVNDHIELYAFGSSTTVSGFSYEWSGPGPEGIGLGSRTEHQNPDFDAGLLSGGTYVLTITETTSGVMCENAGFIEITVGDSPTISNSNPSNTECGAIPHTVSNVTTTATSYSWNISNGTGSLNDDEILLPTYSPSASDVSNEVTVVLTFTAEGSGLCGNATSDYEISYSPAPIAMIPQTNASICQTDDYQFSGVVASNGTRSWVSTGNGSFLPNATVINPRYVPGPGDIGSTVTLTLNVNGANACTGTNESDDFELTIDPIPTAEAGQSTLPLCENEAITINDATATNHSLVSWTANPTTGTLSGETTLTPTYTAGANAGNTDITLTLTANGSGACSSEIAQDTRTIAVKNLPEVSSLSQECNDQDVFTLTGVALNANSVSISPNPNNGSITLEGNGNFTILNLNDNIATYTLTISNANCTITESYSTDDCMCVGDLVPTEPSNTTSDNEICFGDTNNSLSVSVDAGDQANWYTQENGGSPIASNTTTYTPTVNQVNTYSYWVESVDPSTECNSERILITYTINPLPTLTTSDLTVCAGEPGTLTANGSGNGTYTWNGQGVNNQNGKTISLPALGAGSYTYTVTYTENQNDCTSTETLDVTVQEKPTAELSFQLNGATGKYCEGSPSPSIQVDFSGTPPFDLTYTRGNTPITVNNITDRFYTIQNPIPGNYKITSFSDDGCSGDAPSTILTVEEIDLPNPTFEITPGKICLDGEVTIKLTNSPIPADWSYTLTGPGTVNAANTGEYIVDAPGIYTLKVNETSSGLGCETEVPIEVILSTITSTINLGDPINDANGICEGDDITLIATVTSSDAISAFEWEGSSSTDNRITVKPDANTDYEVKVTNEFGCETIAKTTVVVHEPILATFEDVVKENCDNTLVEIDLKNNNQFKEVTWGGIGEYNPDNGILSFFANENITEVNANFIDKNDCTSELIFDGFKTFPLPVIESFNSIFLENNVAGQIVLESVDIVDSGCTSNEIEYVWYIDDIVNGINDANTFHAKTSGPSLTYTPNGDVGEELEVWVEVIDKCGCTSEQNNAVIQITVNSECNLFYDNPTNGCAGDRKEFSTRFNLDSPGLNFVGVEWSIKKGASGPITIISNNGQTGDGWTAVNTTLTEPVSAGDGFATINFDFEIPDTYVVYCTVKYDECENTQNKSVTIRNQPEVDGLVFGEFPEEICYNTSVNIPVTGFPDNFKYTFKYDFDGVTREYDFFNSNKVFRIPAQEDDFTIEFNSMEHTDGLACPIDLNIEPVTVKVLNQLDFNPNTDITPNCNDELDSIQYVLDWDGGKAPYTITYTLPSGTFIEESGIIANTFTTQLSPLGPHNFGLKSQCNDAYSNINVDEGCIECLNISESIPTEKILDNAIVCTNDAFTITLDDLPIDVATYTVVVVLQLRNQATSYEEANVLYEFGRFDAQSFSFDIDYDEVLNAVPDIETDEEYFLVYYPMPKTPDGFVSLGCDGARTIITFQEPEIPEILTTDVTVCQNEYNYLLSSGNPNAKWSFVGIFPGDLYDLGNGNAVVDFTNVNAGDSYDFVVNLESFGCSAQETITINVSEDEDDIAPLPANIYGWPGGIFVYGELDLCYQWGNNNQVIEVGGNDRTLLFEKAFPGQSYNPSNDSIWVEVSYLNDVNCNDCTNRVYYNAQQFPKLSFAKGAPFEVIPYPNPVSDELVVALKGIQGGNFIGRVMTPTGKLLLQETILKEYTTKNWKVDMSNYTPNVYFIQVIDEGGNVYTEKVVKF